MSGYSVWGLGFSFWVSLGRFVKCVARPASKKTSGICTILGPASLVGLRLGKCIQRHEYEQHRGGNETRRTSRSI